METQEQVDRRLEAERHVLIAAALAQSLERFETFATMDSPALPSDPTDAMQVQLYRWQVSRFGLQSDERFALGIIEEVGETFDAEDANEALDGLGDVCVYASQLCNNNRLAIAPILDLARVLQARGEVEPLKGVGKLAHCVLKHAQKIRGQAGREVYRLKLVETIAMCVAKAIDDCEIMHELRIKSTPEVFRIVGGEVMSRGAGHVAIPSTFVEPEKTDVIPMRRDPDAAMAQLHAGIDSLKAAEAVEGTGDWDVSDVRNDARISFEDAIPHHRICPQCGGLLSESGVSDSWVCSNGHGITGKAIAALGPSPLRPK